MNLLEFFAVMIFIFPSTFCPNLFFCSDSFLYFFPPLFARISPEFCPNSSLILPEFFPHFARSFGFQNLGRGGGHSAPCYAYEEEEEEPEEEGGRPGGGGGGVLSFGSDGGVPLKPPNQYLSLRVILAEKGTYY